MSRELRNEHRRNLLALGDAEFADHFKFSQLKVIIKKNTTKNSSFLFVFLVQKKTSSLC
jgi:hypothetical protein